MFAPKRAVCGSIFQNSTFMFEEVKILKSFQLRKTFVATFINY